MSSWFIVPAPHVCAARCVKLVGQTCTNLLGPPRPSIILGAVSIEHPGCRTTQVIGSPEEESRLLLVEATAVVIRQCFSLLGITPLYRI